MHPFTGLALLLPVLLLALRLPSPLLLAIEQLGLLLVLVRCSPDGLSRLRRWGALLLPLALGLLLVHGHWFTPLLSEAERLAALQQALCLWLRVGIMLAATLSWLSSTTLEQLLRALFASRLPPGLAYLLASPLLLKTQLSHRLAAISEAQRSRGVDLQASWLHRWYCLLSLAGPLILWTLADVSERAAALESRAFRHVTPRTTLNAPSFSQQDRLLIATAGLLSLLITGSFLCR